LPESHARTASGIQPLKDKGVQVVAVHMLGGVEGKKKWVKWVNEHEL
jgi:hypothetical protein